MLRLFLLLAIICTSPSCGTPEESGGGTPSIGQTESTSRGRVLLVVQPEDLASDMRTTPVRVILQPMGAPVTAKMISSVMDEIKVTSNAAELEVDVVLAQDNSLDSQSEDRNTEHPTYFDLSPRAGTWPEQWNEVRFATVPGGIEFRGLKSAGTEYISRFYQGFRPTVQAFEICPKEDARTSVILRLSEPVESVTAAAKFRVHQDSAHCEPVVDSSLSARRITLSCRGLALDRSLTLELSSGMNSLSGSPVTLYSGADSFALEVSFSTLAETQEGCRGSQL